MKARAELTIRVSPKMMLYLFDLVRLEGFGEDEGEVIRRLVWDRINELIASGRLKERL